ncbi:MAG: peptide chain release factor 2 [Sandaracinaceae bacterium]|nr:peptide chain release factor 2 [Sandaracinaceae bacterium]MBP7683305.1 peptide chain release factor 2 [Deltaproteobacteria bacterium]MBK7155718.1 peptide chain release factor 2 [Sandaracinaceae bacterium]MBK7775368.1 peptide chain release factor 2 [Sandaracinaceae bacterium]MBK8408166.1 peptide chain release factor 2 [Sandaracinaceae bacterium]
MSSSIGESRDLLVDLAQRLESLGRYLDVEGLQHTVDRLTHESLRDGFWNNQEAAQRVMKERSAAESTVNSFTKLSSEVADLKDLLDMAASEGDQSMADEVAASLAGLEERTRALEVQRMLSPADNENAILMINPGAGGVDAQDWAEMLLRMYLRWCDRHGYKTVITSKQPGDEAGIKEAHVHITGPYAYGYLRAENGVHRLIRISPFDSNARRHTAFASVRVVPDLDNSITLAGVEIRDEDLEIDTMRSGGAGGQHVNRTESAVRIKHVPTGFVIRCESERSQHQNKDHAMKMLRGMLFEKMRRDQEAAFEEAFMGDRAEIAFGSQVRSYTLQPYQMVKDERTDHKDANAAGVLDGDIDAFIETYLLSNADKRRAKETAQKAD